MEKHSTLFYSLLIIFYLLALQIVCGLNHFGGHVIGAMLETSTLPSWLYIYGYSYFVLAVIFLIWGVWTKNSTYTLMYITVTIFINLDIAYYFAPDYTIATLQKIFPFLYWIN